MKIVTMLAVAALLENGARADEVRVCTQSSPVVPIQVLRRAQGLADEMFAGVGVNIDWRRCKSSRSQSMREKPILIEIVSGELRKPVGGELKAHRPSTLAFAFPYEGIRVIILYDRVRQATAPDFIPNLLAHVMVHEITHILQKTDNHSATGIMKAHWTADDFMEMSRKPLSFTEMDIQLIRSGMAGRAQISPLTASTALR